MNRERDTEFIIPVKGLSPGKHSFDFEIGRSFFDEYEEGVIFDANIKAEIVLDKSSTFINLSSSIKGSLKTECDRCLGELDFPVDITPGLLIKFVKSDQEPENDEVLTLEPGESELDIKQFLYDYICLALPIKHVHEEGKCDPVMLSRLTGGTAAEGVDQQENGVEERVNPAFAKLKDLLR